MKGNLRSRLCARKDRVMDNLKTYLENRSDKQRLFIVIGMLTVFAVVDALIMIQALSN